MAEQIRQEFVIDAADALRDLEALMTKFKKLSDSLGSYTRTATEFNRNAGKVVRALTKIKEEAKGAADQLARVSRYKGIVPRAAPAATAAAAAGTGVDPKKTKQAAASLEELRVAAAKVFSGAAIQNQKQFKAGLNELVAGFHRTGGTVDEFKEKIRKLDERINGSKARMTAAMRAIGKSTKKNLSTKPIQSFTVSWKTLGRVIVTQLIVRTLNLVRQAMREAVVEAIEFQRAVAEVGTIANDAYGSLDNIAKIVRETSDEFGKSRLDVAEGLYQTLSNQVGNAAESLHVFRVANKLSIAAVASTEDSVNLLTAALNSFDISTARSEEVAAKLFKTVELGRTRVSELADTFGRIGPLAHSLGISFEETLAAIATITIQGTRTAEALTQVRGVMQALLKPSDNLKKSFREMGVANAEQLIATYGFQGALKELQKTVGTSSSEMGKLIRRVRGLLGAITLASSDAETFVDNLRDIENTTAAILEKKYILVFETPGEKLSREWNKLKNILVVDIGTALIDVTNATIEWTKYLYSAGKAALYFAGVLSTFLIPAMIRVSFLMRAQIAQWVAQAAKIAIARSATLNFAASAIKAAVAAKAAWLAALGPLTILIAAVGSFAYILKRQANEVTEMNAVLSELIKTQKEYNITLSSRALQQQFTLQKKINALNISDTLKTIAAVQRAYQKRSTIVAELDKREVESTKAKFQNILDALEDYQSKYEDIATDAAEAISESQDRIYDINKQGENDKYKRSLRYLDSQDKVHAQQKRILELNREAQALLVTGDPKKIERALALYGDAEKIYGTLKDLAWDQLEPLEKAYKAGTLSRDRMVDLRKARLADNQALKLGTNLTNARLAAEKKLQAVEQERQRVAEQRAEQLKGLNKQFQNQFDIIFDNMSQFDKDNKRLSADELQEQAAARARAFASIRNLAKEMPEFDYKDFFGLAQLSAELDKSLSDKELTIAEESINQMGTAIAEAFTGFMSPALESQIREMSRIMGVEFDPTRGVEGLSDAYVEAGKNVDQLGEKLLEIQTTEEQIREARVAGEKTLIVARTVEDRPWYRKELYAAIDLIGKMKKGTNLTNDEMAQLDTYITGIEGAWDHIGDDAIVMAGHLKSMRASAAEVLVHTQTLKEQQAEYNKLGGDKLLVSTQNALATSADRRVEALKAMAPLRAEEDIAIQQTKTLEGELATIQKTRLDDSLKAIDIWKQAQLTAYEDVARKMQQEQLYTPVDIVGATEQTKKLGGLIQGYVKGGLVKQLAYLAKGNFARGTDTIPAMLSPGEFVMNSKSTRRFFSQLVAMNSGRSPIFRQDGGSVTNVTVGDVNITGGGTRVSANQHGRQVVAAIKREMRRGTSSF